ARGGPQGGPPPGGGGGRANPACPSGWRGARVTPLCAGLETLCFLPAPLRPGQLGPAARRRGSEGGSAVMDFSLARPAGGLAERAIGCKPRAGVGFCWVRREPQVSTSFFPGASAITVSPVHPSPRPDSLRCTSLT